MATVRLEGVEKEYKGGVKAVAKMDLEIQEGDFAVLLGPSGCGKSTTLRMIAGLDDPTGGTIYIDNRPVNDVEPKNRDIAMVFQNYALYPHLTVRENLGFSLKLKKSDPATIERRVNEAAALLSLDELLARLPGQLSGGQRQRVAVGRAIVRKPKVFLFDEPLSNLDAKLRAQMRAELSRLHTRLGSTMIYVTHDQVEAMTMASKIIIMKNGYIQQIADPMTIYNRPANRFVAGFIGAPPMNLLTCTVVSLGDAAGLDAGVTKLRLPKASSQALQNRGYIGKQVIFGIRPEDVFDRLFTQSEMRDSSLKATVEVVEPLGSEIQCILKAGKNEIIAKFKPDSQVAVGDEIDLAFNMEKMHLFDSETEKRIE